MLLFLVVLIAATGFFSIIFPVVIYAGLLVPFGIGLSKSKEIKPCINYKIGALMVLICLGVEEVLGDIGFGICYLIYAVILLIGFIHDLQSGEQTLPLISKYALVELGAMLFAPILLLVLIWQVLKFIALICPFTDIDFWDAVFILSFFSD